MAENWNFTRTNFAEDFSRLRPNAEMHLNV